MSVRILSGHVLDKLAEIAPNSVQVCVTSPPYYGLRSYGTEPQVWGGHTACEHEWGELIPGDPRGGSGPNRKDASAMTYARALPKGAFCQRCTAWRGELGQEPTLALYLDHLLMVFAVVWRVLRPDGTCFVNLGDSYDSQKSLHLMPHQFALMMKSQGWTVRNDLIWAKTACMPESVTDRATRSHEYVWHFAKSARYYYDAEAVREESIEPERVRNDRVGGANGHAVRHSLGGMMQGVSHRNQRTVWHIGPEPLRDEHYAAWPTEIPRRCILAGSSEKGQCPACCAPWVRTVERTGGTWQERRGLGAPIRYGVNGVKGTPGGGPEKNLGSSHAETTGWSPSCACDAGDPIPQTVLDPFIGSGRTGIMADRLGRDCIGIDLSPANVAMSERLIRGDSPMFAMVEVMP